MADNKTKQVETNLDLLTQQKPGAVVIDADGYAWQKGGDEFLDRWYRCLFRTETLSTDELAATGPITATTADKTKRKHKKPAGLVHTSKAHYDAHRLLDDMPHGSVVLDRHGEAWQDDTGYWFGSFAVPDEPLSSYDLAFHAPITPLTTK